MLKKYGWMLVVPGLILFSVIVFILWQKSQLKKAKPDMSEGRRIRSELFLQNQGATSSSGAVATQGENASADPAAPSVPWRDTKIPDFPLITQKYSSMVGRARMLMSAELAPTDQTEMRPMVETESAFVQQAPLADGRILVRMFDKRSGELLSERWGDPQLGEVVRSFHREFQSVSLSARSSDLQIDLVSIPTDRAEYATVKGKDERFVSILEGGRRSEYWADLKQNRFVENQNGRNRQWLRIGENRFQEINEAGRRLSIYRVDPDTREIVLAE